MPHLTRSVPKYRRHKPTGQAVVTIAAKDYYLGPYGTKASKVEYDRLIGEWLAAGRPAHVTSPQDAITVTELVAAYYRFAKSYYEKNGESTETAENMRPVLRMMRQLYGHTLALEFGPLALKSLQSKMVSNGQSRTYANMNVARIKRMYKWAVSEELVPPAVYHALSTVSGLRKGRTEARETPAVSPVCDETVEATLPHLPKVVADMVGLQRLTGCRPGEVCILRPCDVNTSGDVWEYRPESHKTEHHNRERVIFIGPRAQDVLRPYLLRDKSAYCFAPAESERKRNAQRREIRQTPITPSQACRRPKQTRRRAPGDRYSSDSFRRAVHRACDLAGVERWCPNRLRHTAGTEIRKRFGLEAAQVTLGHAAANVTQIYAERDLAKAADVMREVG